MKTPNHELEHPELAELLQKLPAPTQLDPERIAKILALTKEENEKQNKTDEKTLYQ